MCEGLHELAEHTDFENKDESIRDRLVLGITDRELSQKLQLMKDLTLQTAIEEARHYELVKGQVDIQRKPEHSVDAIGKNKKRGGGRPPRGRGNKNGARASQNNERCEACGYIHARDMCPAKGKSCNYCTKPNHFKKMCRKYLEDKSKKKVDNVETGASNVYFMGSVADKSDSSSAWRETLTLGRNKISFKLDTGADVSVISTETFENLNPRPTLKKTSATLQSPGGKLSCLGTFKTEVKTNKSKTGNIEIYVLEGKSDNLLSRDAATYFDFVKRIGEVDESM